ncbi:MAG: autoinducer binding domain-containing protein [Alphaproteobacteria bacterium]
MNSLENYVEQITLSKNPQEAFDKYCSIVKAFGYDRAVYSLITDHPSLSLPRQHGLITDYPETWMKHYVENNYIDEDPVILRISKSQTPFFWSDLEKLDTISNTSQKLMLEAEEEGIADGVGISLQGCPGEVVGVGLARTGNSNDNAKDYEMLSSAYFITVFFHETYRSMMGMPLRTELSKREQEVLLWAAEGKTDEEVGIILGISQNTIRFHWKNIFKKLDAYGRVYAVTKAIRLNLITPYIINTPYQKR